MQQLRQAFLSFWIVFEPHDGEEMLDNESEKVEAEHHKQCRSGAEEDASSVIGTT